MASLAFKLTVGSRLTNKIIFNRHLIASNRYICSKNDNEDENLKSDELGLSAEKEPKGNLSQSGNENSKTLRTKISKPVLSEEAKEAAKKKLEELLSDIKVEPSVSQTSVSKLNLARAVKRMSKKERFPPPAPKISPVEKMNLAVKAVASTLQGDPEKIETELKTKLTSVNLSEDSEFEEKSAEEKSDHLINTEMSKNIMSSVKDVAAKVSEAPAAPKSKLVQKLMELSEDNKGPLQKDSMFNLIEGMKVQADEDAKRKFFFNDKDTSQFKSKRLPSRQSVKNVDLFGFPPLDIFPADTKSKPEPKNILWKALQEKELKLLVQFAPTNAFEEMLIWTEQGKHWKFPIDNEIDVGPEENVGFHEHVFLEQHLKGFPTKGPIRHFMELVVVGLSKNPYISVDRKIENINWFRDYFKDKEQILIDTGAIC